MENFEKDWFKGVIRHDGRVNFGNTTGMTFVLSHHEL